MNRVLIVDDDDSFREVMQFHLHEDGVEADAAADGPAALALFDPALHGAVVTDFKMPKMDGLELLRRLKERSPETAVVMITAFGDIEMAVEAMKAGAFDFIPKPCGKEHFKLTIRKALAHTALAARVRELESVVASGARELIFRSARMSEVVALIDRVAPSPATVLIMGESGVGKELLAQRLHRKSNRREKAFVAVNCGALPHELIESELFGHVKGAFTGAVRDRKGKFEQAHQGTLFLDEISELPLPMQSKLLRALSERTIDVVGKEQPQTVDVRVVAATNQDLAQAVAAGRFRQDLFYRLNVVAAPMPALRDRPEDIPLLADYFLARFSPERPLHLAEDARRALLAHAWPGNVRELENLCQRLALLAETEEIGPELLPPWSAPPPPAAAMSDAEAIKLPATGVNLVDLERNVIVEALKMNHYNQTKTARFLGIPRHILLYRLKKFDIPLPPRGE
jgi:two-component system NtrC family response regulator